MYCGHICIVGTDIFYGQILEARIKFNTSEEVHGLLITIINTLDPPTHHTLDTPTHHTKLTLDSPTHHTLDTPTHHTEHRLVASVLHCRSSRMLCSFVVSDTCHTPEKDDSIITIL